MKNITREHGRKIKAPRFLYTVTWPPVNCIPYLLIENGRKKLHNGRKKEHLLMLILVILHSVRGSVYFNFDVKLKTTRGKNSKEHLSSITTTPTSGAKLKLKNYLLLSGQHHSFVTNVSKKIHTPSKASVKISRFLNRYVSTRKLRLDSSIWHVIAL